MSVRSAQVITTLFTTRNATTGVGVNADSLPTGTLYVNGTADAASVTVTNIDTGRYKAAVTLPTLAVGDIVDLSISATVNSVSDKAVIWRDTKDVLLDSSGDVTFSNTSIATVTTVTNQLTAAAIATGVWQDTTANDFTVSSSIGKSLYTTGNAPGAASGLALVGSNMGTITGGTVTTVTNQLTAAQIATGVWQDTTANDFNVSSSIGKSLYTTGNVPGAASGLALVGSNMGTITGGTVTTVTNQLTAAQIATGVWQDATPGDFTVSSSIGKSLFTSGNAPGAASGLALVGSNMGTITGGTVTTLTNLPTIPNNWITAAGIASDAGTEVAAAVWDLATSGHTTSGTFGAAMAAAGSVGDPWTTAIPGSYPPGSAGYVVGNYLDERVSAVTEDVWSSLLPASHPSGSAGWLVGNYLDAQLSAVAAKTAHLPDADMVNTSGKLWVLDSDGNPISGSGGDVTLAASQPNYAPSKLADIQTALTALSAHGDTAWATATGFATSADLTALSAHGDATWASPTVADIAAGIVAYDLGNGRTVSYFLQGGTNKVTFAANGLSYTVYSTDDTTPLYTGTSTRLAASVGGLRSIDPT